MFWRTIRWNNIAKEYLLMNIQNNGTKYLQHAVVYLRDNYNFNMEDNLWWPK